MAITKRPSIAADKSKAHAAAIDKFISAAPDASPSKTPEKPASTFTGQMRGKQAQIAFALPPELLAKVDHQAARLSISRAAFIKQALSRAVEAEGF